VISQQPGYLPLVIQHRLAQADLKFAGPVTQAQENQFAHDPLKKDASGYLDALLFLSLVRIVHACGVGQGHRVGEALPVGVHSQFSKLIQFSLPIGKQLFGHVRHLHTRGLRATLHIQVDGELSCTDPESQYNKASQARGK